MTPAELERIKSETYDAKRKEIGERGKEYYFQLGPDAATKLSVVLELSKFNTIENLVMAHLSDWYNNAITSGILKEKAKELSDKFNTAMEKGDSSDMPKIIHDLLRQTFNTDDD